MRLIIAGGRDLDIDIDSIVAFVSFLNIPHPITEIVSGGATGVDRSGEQYAKRFGKGLNIFAADWNVHGKAAGPIRNKQMAQYADALLLIWDGKSRGSLSMKTEALNAGLPIYEIIRKTYEAQE